MDQTGSVLAAGIVILGIFSILFAAGVRHEGSAQELDIFTAHRRQALDVARGGIEALRVQYDKKYDTITGTLALGPDEPVDENSTLATAAGKDPTDPSRVVLMSRATVAGVMETIRVTLASTPGGGLFENFFGETTVATEGNITVSGSADVTVEEPVYYSGKTVNGSGTVQIPRSITDKPDIPDIDTVRAQASAYVDSLVFDRVVSNLGTDVVTANTRLTKEYKKNGSGNARLEVKNGSWLVIDGSLSISGSVNFY